MNSISKRNLLAAVIVAAAVLLCLVLALPRPELAIDRFTPSNLLLNFLPAVYFLLAFWLVSRRPLTSAVLTAIVCLAITFGSNFKFAVTSQPLVASDFIVFIQVVENPALFEKYFREQWYFLPLLVIMLVSAVSLIRLERPVVLDKRMATLFVAFGVVLLMQIQLVMLKPQAPLHYIYRSLSPEFDHRDPMTSVRQLGLFTTLINSARSSYFTWPVVDAADRKLVNELADEVASPQPAVDPLPNLVVVQNEAFFDFRVIDAAFPDTAYVVWDRLKKQSQHGLLTVDTYGGATLRTEFSMLTGIPLAMFGSALDYPYLTAVSRPLESFPRHLKSLSYQTIAVHPFSKTFWRRHVAYPRLGFDSFLAIDQFGDEANDGPYVSDRAVCQKILELLGEDDRPKFIFAVTMENHGPWSFDRQQTGDLGEAEFDEYDLNKDIELQLMRYLYHARNAAAMAACLIEGQSSLRRPTVLLFYGDHAPALPAVFAAMDVENPWRDPAMRSVPYLLWNRNTAISQEMHNAVSALPAMLLKAAQLPPDDYLRMTDHLRQQCRRDRLIHDSTSCPESANNAMRALIRLRLQPLDQP